MSESLYIQLIWEEPLTGEINQPMLTPPIAIGREKSQMPENLGIHGVSQVELINKQVSRFHALITVANEQLYITDKSSNGTYVNGRQIPKGSQPFSSKDTIRIGPYKITAILVTEKQLNSTDINREVNNPSGAVSIAQKNTFFIWIMGAILIIFLGVGVWFSVKTILDHLRPNLPEKSLNNNP
jgi:pSer/pThr/pTyr-binding forkhead associated (FHA) protein